MPRGAGKKFRCLTGKVKPGKKEFAAKLRKNMTWAEKILWSKVKEKKLGFRVYSQKVVYGYIVDFWISCGIAIEIDGSSHDNKKDYDKHRDLVLKQQGILTMRFTNQEVFNNLNIVISLIKDQVKRRSK
jgi:leucyl-tRNA synthetase